MTPGQVQAIQDSFSRVKPMSDQVAELFYGRLFEIAPTIKPLFRGDIKEQGRKLMAALATVVHSLGNLDSVLPAARALAKSRFLRGERGRLRTCRRSTALDTGTRPWRAVDA